MPVIRLVRSCSNSRASKRGRSARAAKRSAAARFGRVVWSEATPAAPPTTRPDILSRSNSSASCARVSSSCRARACAPAQRRRGRWPNSAFSLPRCSAISAHDRLAAVLLRQQRHLHAVRAASRPCVRASMFSGDGVERLARGDRVAALEVLHHLRRRRARRGTGARSRRCRSGRRGRPCGCRAEVRRGDARDVRRASPPRSRSRARKKRRQSPSAMYSESCHADALRVGERLLDVAAARCSCARSISSAVIGVAAEALDGRDHSSRTGSSGSSVLHHARRSTRARARPVRAGRRTPARRASFSTSALCSRPVGASPRIRPASVDRRRSRAHGPTGTW